MAAVFANADDVAQVIAPMSDKIAIAAANGPANTVVSGSTEYVQEAGGGGGYGDPLERDPEKVLDDVLDGFINETHAREDYGVVLTEVDEPFTPEGGAYGHGRTHAHEHGATAHAH